MSIGIVKGRQAIKCLDNNDLLINYKLLSDRVANKQVNADITQAFAFTVDETNSRFNIDIKYIMDTVTSIYLSGGN